MQGRAILHVSRAKLHCDIPMLCSLALLHRRHTVNCLQRELRECRGVLHFNIRLLHWHLRYHIEYVQNWRPARQSDPIAKSWRAKFTILILSRIRFQHQKQRLFSILTLCA